MSKITFNCPFCHKKLNAPERVAGQSLACPNCKQFVVVPNLAPETEETPDNSFVPKGNPFDVPASVSPKLHLKTIPTIEVDMLFVVGIVVAGVGLLMLGISPLLRWVNVAMGGMIGVSGDGKILLVVTLVMAGLYLYAIIRHKLMCGILVQVWGIVTAFWMGALFWKFSSSISNLKNDAPNPIAAMMFSQVTPGAGLYVGMLGGILLAVAGAYLIIRYKTLTILTTPHDDLGRLLGRKILVKFYLSEMIGCVVGVSIVLFYVLC